MEKDPAASTAGHLNAGFAAPGLHLLLDFRGGRHARDAAAIEEALRAAAAACGAEVLQVMLHSFGGDTGGDLNGQPGGVTGVALLAESHISIHTWPEIDYIALDIFVCGGCDARKGADVLINRFQPARYEIIEHHRGGERPMKVVAA